MFNRAALALLHLRHQLAQAPEILALIERRGDRGIFDHALRARRLKQMQHQIV